MSDDTAFERSLAAALDAHAGPRRDVDARAIASAVIGETGGSGPVERRREWRIRVGLYPLVRLAAGVGAVAIVLPLLVGLVTSTFPDIAREASPAHGEPVGGLSGPLLTPGPDDPERADVEGLGKGQPSAAAQGDGVLVEIWLDRDKVEVGDEALTLVRVTNTGDRMIRYDASPCSPVLVKVEVVRPVDDNPFDQGAHWHGTAAGFKQEALRHLGYREDEVMLGAYRDPSIVGSGRKVCIAVGVLDKLLPGESKEVVKVWRVEAQGVDQSEGAFVPTSGPAKVRATFERIVEVVHGQRVTVETVAAAVDVTISGEAGPQREGMTPIDLIDIALSDDWLAGWLEEAPRESWLNPHLTYWPSSSGHYPAIAPYDELNERPIAEVGLFRIAGQREAYGGVIIDRSTGEILARRSE
jgi:hypothetical protein